MSFRSTLFVAAMIGLLPPAAVAQSYGLPPADVGGGYSNAQTSDSANLVVRIDRLEEQVRQLTGQLQEVQYANKRLEDLLKKFQQDVDYRFQEKGGAARPQHRSDAEDAIPPVAAPAQTAPARTAAGRRSDAFDPSNDPTAPGAPRSLGGGGGVASAPLGGDGGYGRPYQPSVAASDPDGDPNAPLDLSGGRLRASEDGAAPPSAGPPRAPRVIPLGPTASAAVGDVTPGGTSFAGAPVTPKGDFDLAMGYLKDKQYESAERGFSAFIQKNPKNRLASDAYYYLGESYLQRGRQAEAGQQYMKVVTDYASSPRAPEAMLRLGEALQALGSKEQACASFSQVARKYPNASVAIKSRAEREAKRFQC